MDITFPGLASLNDAVNIAYLQALQGGAPPVWQEFAYDATSTGTDEVYPFMAGIPGLREWVGERVTHELSVATFTIRNKTWENTIGVKREDIEDDKLQLIIQPATMLGANVKAFPDQEVAALMKNGHTTLTYDNQNFYDVAHPNYTSSGQPTTVANYTTGAGPSWYLFDTSLPVRALIYQTRRPFRIVPRFSLTDPVVFDNNQFVWGVDGRANAGYGLWHLSYRSDTTLNLANIIAARTAMATLRRPDGTPMGLADGGSTVMVVPTALYSTAQAYATNEWDPNPPTAGTMQPNTVRGLFRVIENKYLN